MAHDSDFTDTTGLSGRDQIFALIDRYAARVSRREASSGSNVQILDVEQRARLLELPLGDPARTPLRDLLADYASAVAAIVRTQVLFVESRGGTPAVVASAQVSGRGDARAAAGQAPRLDARLAPLGAAPAGADVFVSTHHDREWTVAPVGAAGLALLLEGDWSLSAATLRRLAANVGAILRPAGPVVSDSLRRAHRLARTLGRVEGMTHVAKTALDHIVRAVPSDSAVCAIPGADGTLSIVATHGYPLALVDHIRIPPGSGVLGAVYERRAPMRVVDTEQLPLDRPRRAQYHRRSFIAVPALAGRTVVGVVCLTERAAAGPYTRAEVSLVRALLAPAALAIARERAREDAESMAHAAVIDPVSGLFNRRYFQARLEEELVRARRHKPSVGLLMVDIDDFKAVNDTHGHIVGDAVLRGVAAVLRDSVRASDITTRFGGEEFAVLLPRSDARNARNMAERIRSRIEHSRLERTSEPPIQVTVSVGVATSLPGTTATQLISQADAALYRAKRAGRNQVCSADDESAP